MDTPHLPAPRARTLLLNGLGLTAIVAGLVVYAPPGTGTAGALPVTNSFCAAAGGTIPNDTATGRLLQIPVSAVPADVTDVDVRLLGVSENPADDLDSFVAAPNGDYSYLASDVGGSSAVSNVDVEFDDEASGSITASNGTFVAGTFKPSNQNNSENSFPFPTGFTSGPSGTLDALDDSSAIGTWRIWLVDDGSTGTGGSITGACIDLTSANTAPTAGPIGLLTTNEDTALPITLLGADADTGQPLTYSITAQPAQGTITQVAGANWLYTPPANFNNPSPAAVLSFTYQVSDGTEAASNTGTIRVLPVNDAPVAPDQAVSTAEDLPLGITLTSSDIDGGAPTYSILSGPSHGTITGGTGAARTYTPTGNFNGADSFTFQADDGAGGTDTGVVSITVGAVNDAPTADADSYNATEDTALTVPASGVLVGDDDGDPELTQPLSAALVTGPTHGTLVLNGDGSFTYTPAADYAGPDSFTYRADDGGLESAPATVTIDVGAINDAPTADDQSVSTLEDTATAITLTGDDVDGDTLTFTVAAPPQHGAVTGTGAARTYTPDADYAGPDSFTFTVTDGFGEVDSATVSIVVTPVDDLAVPQGDSYATTEDVTLTVVAPGVLGNDADIDGGTRTAQVVDGAAHGGLALAADGSFSYAPDPDFNGSDSFTYRVTNGFLTSAPVTVTIVVTPANDVPFVTGETYGTDEDVPLVVAAPGLLANDSDTDGDALATSAGASGATHGTVNLAPDGGFTYVPDLDFHGADGFSYLVNDGHGGTVEAAVAITVTGVNDAPVGTDQGVSTAEDTPLGLVLAATDVDGDTPAFTLDAGPAHGTLNGSGANRTYTPSADYHGPDQVTFAVSDGNGGTGALVVDITVTPVNDDPVADDESFTVAEDDELTFPVADLLAGDTDIDGDTLSVTGIVSPSDAFLSVPGGLNGSPNVAHLQPDPDFHGTITFDYSVGDGHGGGDIGTITVTVTPVNDAPVAVDDSYTTGEDDPLVVLPATGMLANDVDVDGDPLTATVDDGPDHGTVTVGSAGGFTYQPAPDFVGTDHFTYTTSDGDLGDTGTVAVEVGPNENDAPVAGDDAYTTDEDTSLVVGQIAGVLADDTDADAGDVLAVSLAPGGGTNHGSLTLQGDGSFTYTPDPDFNGSDSFTYAVTDGDAADEATVTITVDPVNDEPVGTDDDDPAMLTVDEDGTLAVPAAGVLANDSDADGDPLTASLVTPTGHGTLTLGTDGSLTYVPDPEFNGTDTFTYAADDGAGDDTEDTAVLAATTAPVTVTITVVPVPDAPVAVADAVTVAAGTTAPIAVLDNDSDPDGDPLAVAGTTSASRGVAACTAVGCSYSADPADPGGVVTFDYTVEDGTGGTATATVSVTVLAAGQVTTTTTATTAPASTTTATTASQVRSGSQLPRTGTDSRLWSVGAVLLGLGLCASGTGTLVHQHVEVRRRRR